jgi:hypothetical protein
LIWWRKIRNGEIEISATLIASFFWRRFFPRATFSISVTSGSRCATTNALPPSVLVSEVLGYLAENFEMRIGEFVFQHPLQGLQPPQFSR